MIEKGGLRSSAFSKMLRTNFEDARALIESGLALHLEIVRPREIPKNSIVDSPFDQYLILKTPDSFRYVKGLYSERTGLFHPPISIFQWFFCCPKPIHLHSFCRQKNRVSSHLEL
jgi:hypothetical protein